MICSFVRLWGHNIATTIFADGKRQSDRHRQSDEACGEVGILEFLQAIIKEN